MPLTTTVTPAAIAVALGVSSPSTLLTQQWQLWIDDALMLINDRVDSITPTPVVNQAKLDYVIREAVVAQVRRPDDATQVTISSDDTSTSKTFRSGSGRVGILDEWWTLLGLGNPGGSAFEIDTTPPAPYYWNGEEWVRRIGQYWTSSRTGRTYASSELGYLDVP